LRIAVFAFLVNPVDHFLRINSLSAFCPFTATEIPKSIYSILVVRTRMSVRLEKMKKGGKEAEIPPLPLPPKIYPLQLTVKRSSRKPGNQR
jgi:hypothetical protein